VGRKCAIHAELKRGKDSDMFLQVEGETNDGPTTTTTNAPTETLWIDLSGLWFPPKATRIVRGKVTRRGKASIDAYVKVGV